MTKAITIGNTVIGGGNTVKIQSMNNTDTRDVKATLEQIMKLRDAGCDITRVAIPDMEAAQALKEITKASPLPVVADIHFDYRLAIESAKNGAAKIRINPGNIGGEDKVKAVADICKERGIPIRVGVNSGSIDRKLVEQYGGVCAENMTLEAYELGVSSVIVGRAEATFEQPGMQAYLDRWGLDADFMPMVFVCLGYIDGPYPPIKERQEGRAIYIGAEEKP